MISRSRCLCAAAFVLAISCLGSGGKAWAGAGVGTDAGANLFATPGPLFAPKPLSQDWNTSPAGPSSKRFQAIGYSALLPGLAQWKLGHRHRAVGFWVAEAAFWTGFVTYRTQGSLREDSYLEMATLFAGVDDAESRDDDYLRRIASWPSSDLFDDLIVRRNARLFSGDDPEARAAYFEDNRIAGQDQWSWSSSAARERFSDKRSDSKTSYKRSRNMIGLAVANRVVAMIDAVVLSNQESDSAYHLRMEPVRSGEHWEGRLSLSRSYR